MKETQAVVRKPHKVPLKQILKAHKLRIPAGNVNKRSKINTLAPFNTPPKSMHECMHKYAYRCSPFYLDF